MIGGQLEILLLINGIVIYTTPLYNTVVWFNSIADYMVVVLRLTIEIERYVYLPRDRLTAIEVRYYRQTFTDPGSSVQLIH